ncbi:MAG: Sua5/YciO/YrdC/YwlC family protein [Cellvibrionaceae bacterium]|nr:Sua5/YciO/YrdC/YwlC family protein [Cellvibrionaceae bacterium]
MQFWQSHPRVRLCGQAVKRGEVIAYPTEAVWGLGCDPFNRVAVEAILRLKRRAASKGLIIVAASVKQVDFLLEKLSQAQRLQLENSWPGPNTWLVPHFKRIPPWVSGASTSVAVRVSAHPVVQALCSVYGGPIVSTSANVQAKPPAKTALAVRRYFKGCPLVYSPGDIGGREKPSVIRDLLNGQVIRA